MRRSFILAGLAAASLVASVASSGAQQQRMVRVGVLECRGGASVGFIVGSVTNLGCVLRADGLPEDRYVATIRKVGLDIGITQETALAWGVFAPVDRLGPGDLSGNYAGAQGSASVGVGYRRQRAGRWLQQFDRAPAAQRAGPGRPQRRRRPREPGTPSGPLTDFACADRVGPTRSTATTHRSDV